MIINQTRFTQETRAVAIALALGVALCAVAIGLGQTVESTAAQTSDHRNASTLLSDKKTCIMLAWHQQSGGIDRAQCAQYLAQWNAHRQSLAENH
jgi:hypothetical protein